MLAVTSLPFALAPGVAMPHTTVQRAVAPQMQANRYKDKEERRKNNLITGAFCRLHTNPCMIWLPGLF